MVTRESRSKTEEPLSLEAQLEDLDTFDRALLTDKLEKPRISKRALAKKYKQNENTIGKRMNRLAFVVALEALSREKAKSVLQVIDELAVEAANKLGERMRSSEKHVVEVMASKALLEFGVGKKERVSVEDPVDVIIEYGVPNHSKLRKKTKKKS